MGCNLHRAAGTDERIYVWITVESEPDSTPPLWSFTTTTATGAGTMTSGQWDGDTAWSSASGIVRCWSPLLASEALTSASGTYQAWVLFTVGDQGVLVKPDGYLVLE